MNWSGGKDSALCLHQLLKEGHAVEALVTVVNSTTDRIAMHGVRRELLEAQAGAIGLPLHIISLPEMPDSATYEEAVRKAHQQLKEEGFTHAAFGDIFLEDLKYYREQLLAKDDLECLLPLWKKDTKALAKKFIIEGFKALTCCVNTALGESFCGAEMNDVFFNALPDAVDTCGENGEYHSFVYDGPVFKQPVFFIKGEVVYKEYPSPEKDMHAAGFYFRDLLP